MARSARDRRLHPRGIKLPPARADVLIRAQQVKRAGICIEALRQRSLGILDRREAVWQTGTFTFGHDDQRLYRDSALCQTAKRRRDFRSQR